MEVLEATQRLHDRVIPQLASVLDDILKDETVGMLDINFSYELHRRGGMSQSTL